MVKYVYATTARRLYKPSVDERLRHIKATRDLLREYGTVKELKLNLEALSWGQLTDLHEQLEARIK